MLYEAELLQSLHRTVETLEPFEYWVALSKTVDQQGLPSINNGECQAGLSFLLFGLQCSHVLVLPVVISFGKDWN